MIFTNPPNEMGNIAPYFLCSNVLTNTTYLDDIINTAMVNTTVDFYWHEFTRTDDNVIITFGTCINDVDEWLCTVDHQCLHTNELHCGMSPVMDIGTQICGRIFIRNGDAYAPYIVGLFGAFNTYGLCVMRTGDGDPSIPL